MSLLKRTISCKSAADEKVSIMIHQEGTLLTLIQVRVVEPYATQGAANFSMPEPKDLRFRLPNSQGKPA